MEEDKKQEKIRKIWENTVLCEKEKNKIFQCCKWFFSQKLDFDAQVQREFSKMGDLETIQFMATNISNFNYEKCLYDSVSERENIKVTKWLIPFIGQDELEYLLEGYVGWFDGEFTDSMKEQISFLIQCGAKDFQSAFQPTIYFYSENNKKIWDWLVENQYLSKEEFEMLVVERDQEDDEDDKNLNNS